MVDLGGMDEAIDWFGMGSTTGNLLLYIFVVSFFFGSLAVLGHRLYQRLVWHIAHANRAASSFTGKNNRMLGPFADGMDDVRC